MRKYIGVDDLDLDLFESQYAIPDGVSYNSYLLVDEKTAIIDTVDARKAGEWMDRLEGELGGREPSYLVLHHLEPDHSGVIDMVMERFPHMVIVAGTKAVQMLPQFCGTDYTGRTIAVKEGDVLELGEHRLKFYSAPMVHWPEVMVSLDGSDGSLFSADAFGRFGALSRCGYRSCEYVDWAGEARRYYYNIVGKYGGPVSSLLAKLSGLQVKAVLPLHGPELHGDLGKYLDLYSAWAAYRPEKKGVLIACASMHGGTMEAARHLAGLLRARGTDAEVRDLCRDDMSRCISDAFMYTDTVFAACTYDGGLFTPMVNFLHRIQAKGYCSRRAGIIENGSWAPVAGREIKEKLGGMKSVELVEPVVTIRSRMNEADRNSLEELADALSS